MNAQKKGTKNLICSRFDDDLFNNSSVGFAGLFDVIEHIEDDQSFLRILNKKLKDDGMIILTAPACSGLLVKRR